MQLSNDAHRALIKKLIKKEWIQEYFVSDMRICPDYVCRRSENTKLNVFQQSPKHFFPMSTFSQFPILPCVEKNQTDIRSRLKNSEFNTKLWEKVTSESKENFCSLLKQFNLVYRVSFQIIEKIQPSIQETDSKSWLWRKQCKKPKDWKYFGIPRFLKPFSLSFRSFVFVHPVLIR